MKPPEQVANDYRQDRIISETTVSITSWLLMVDSLFPIPDLESLRDQPIQNPGRQ